MEGYVLRTEEVGAPNGDTVESVLAYTVDGKCIGSKEMAHLLVVDCGIVPELATPTSRVCTIGFCKREAKWYGWSHRACYGFEVGDVADEGSCLEEELPDDFVVNSLEDAKRMAIAFAECVS